MKPSEFRELSDDELKHKEQELREKLFYLKVQHATGQLDNTQQIPQMKQDIARVLTILRERRTA